MSEQELSNDEVFDAIEEVPDEYVSPLASGDEEELEDEVLDIFDDESGDFDTDESDEDSEDVFVSDFDEDGEAFSDDDFEAISGEIEAVSVTDTGTDLAAVPELTIEEAKELTEHIRSTADVLYVLVARAHAGKAHLALGYSTFGDYVKEEFNISRSRAYQFINQANVIAAIEEATPDGTQFRLSEAAARDLKNYVEEMSPEIRDKTEGLEPNEAGKVVEEIVSEYRDKLKESQDDEDDELDFNFDLDDLDDIEYEAPEFGDNNGGGGGGSEFDDMENFDNLDDFSATDLPGDGISIDDPSVFREKLENVYAFYTALTALEKMPSPEEIMDSIQEARKPHINASLPKAKAWLDAFNEAWFSSDLEAPEKEEENSDLDFDALEEEAVRE